MQRFVFQDTGAGSVVSSSQAYRRYFLTRRLGSDDQCVVSEDDLTAEFSLLTLPASHSNGNDFDCRIWKALGDPCFSPANLRRPWPTVHRWRVTPFDLWQRLVDSSTSSVMPDASGRADRARAMCGRIVPRSVLPAEQGGFIDALAEELLNYDIVYATIPPGYGKTLFASTVIRALTEKEEAIRGSVVQPTRGALDREPKLMTKILQCAPTVSVVVSAATFLREQSQTMAREVKGMVHAAIDTEGAIFSDCAGVEHVIVPAREAERAIEKGRFKALVIDEFHLNDAANPTCLMLALEAMCGSPESAALSHATARRRLDKLLVLSSTRSDRIRAELTETLDAYCKTQSRLPLVYSFFQYPRGIIEWEQRNFPVRRLLMSNHTEDADVAGSELLMYLRSKLLGVLGDADSVARMDEELAGEGRRLLLDSFYERISGSARSLIGLFRGHETRLHDSDDGRSEMYRYPNIMVYVPSTGVAKQVYNKLAYADENKVYCRNGWRYYQPYKIRIASRTDDLEEEMIVGDNRECPEWIVTSEKKQGRKPQDVMELSLKGSVIIVVNGTEAGLTVSNVGGVVDSGLEWVRDEYSRDGLATYRFILSDYELVEQRAGRAGRTRPTQHILCLSPIGQNLLFHRGADVMMQMRWRTLTQNGFIRLTDAGAPERHDTFEWCQHAVESRVEGSTVEADAFEAPSMQLPLRGTMTLHLTPSSCELRKKMRNVTPTLSAMLRAFISAGVALHGLVRVAMLSIDVKALMKPSQTNFEKTTVGPRPDLNSLDIFMKGVTNYEHDGNRVVRPYCGDSVAIAEMHAQLVVATNWNIEQPVFCKEDIITATERSDFNFWHGKWIDMQWLRTEKKLKECMDYNTVEARGDISFLYGRLIADEDRKKLWTEMRNLAMGLIDSGELSRFEALFSEDYNRQVHCRSTDPVLTEAGRAIFNLIDTVYSTRFAKITPGPGKTRAMLYDYAVVAPDNGTPTVVRKQLGVRAEGCWDAQKPTEHWLKFDPSSSSMPGCHLCCSDPLTDMAMALFANCNGRWRTGIESSLEEASSRTLLSSFDYVQAPWAARNKDTDDGGKKFYLEIETNAGCGIYGIRFEFESEHDMMAVSNFRSWLRSHLPAIVHHKAANVALLDAPLTKVYKIWQDATRRKAPTPYPNRPFFT